ncbi:hypothetical protein TIFTF001_051322, partial [Ficus carica]
MVETTKVQRTVVVSSEPVGNDDGPPAARRRFP